MPDFGSPPVDTSARRGVTDEESFRRVARVTAGVREPRVVQALTLRHAPGTAEVACNLLQTRVRSVAAVLASILALSEEAGCEVISHYTTGPSYEELLDMLEHR